MKRWIDKTWAKVTAFCLMVLFAVLTAAGAVGLTWLVEEDVYLDGGATLRRDLYFHECYDELRRAESWLWGATGGAVFASYQTEWDAADRPAPALDEDSLALAEAFRSAFESSSCRLTLEDAEGRLLLENGGEEAAEPLCSESDDLYTAREQVAAGAPAYRLTAQLRPGYTPEGYEELFSELGIRWRWGLLALEALFLALFLFFLVFTLASAGHWQGHEGVHLTWLDRIPLEVWFLTFALPVGMMDDWHYGLPPFMALAILTLLVLLFLPVFAAQCKAGTVLRCSLCARLLRLLWRVLRALGRILSRLPLVWKTALAVAVLLLFDVLCAANCHDEEFLVAMLAVNLLAGLFLLYLAIGLRELQKGGRALAEGSYETAVDTRYLFGDFRRHGENLNAIQQGVQKAVEQQMRSERMKTELITNVSHDIKTPLTSIVNYVDLLKKEEIDNPAAREYIDVLERQSGRLRKLTEDLVEASKAAAGSIPVTLTDTDVNVFLSQAAGEYGQRLAENNIEPVLTLDETEPHILADGKLLWRVLDNLLGNVCKYAMPGTRVYVSGERAGAETLLTVKNVSRYPLNVSADELTERFVRGDASRSTEGSGLGLSIASGLTALQKGDFRLTVDGDLFKVTLAFPSEP